MKLTDKIIQDCKELQRICSADLWDALSTKAEFDLIKREQEMIEDCTLDDDDEKN